MQFSASIEQYPYVFRSGETLIDMEVIIGQGDSSSSCTIKIADPGHKHGEALIDHSLKNGGIAPIAKPASLVEGATAADPSVPGSAPSAASDAPTGGGSSGVVLVAEAKELTEKSPRDAWINMIVKTGIANGITDNGQLAYMLATAELECSMGADLVEDWDGKGLQATYQNHPHLGNTQPGDGYRFRGRGIAQATGRGVYRSLSKKMGYDYENNPDLMARGDHAIAIFINGVKNSWFTGSPPIRHYIEGAKQDVYNARRVINGIVPAQVAKLQKFYAQFYPQIDALKARAGGASVPVPKTDPGAVSQPATVLKGNKITCTIGDQEYLFYHTGTTLDESGTTTISGATARWEMNKRERNAMRKDVSLSQVFKEVTEAKGIKSVYGATFDPKYSFLPQVGISDHQLLLREASKAGLFLGNLPDGTVTIKDLPGGLIDTELVLSPGLNLIKYKISDKALDPNATEDDAGSSLNQSEAKAVVEPTTGTLEAKGKDIDKAPTSVTGKPVPKPAGQMQPQDQQVAQVSASRVKRLKGLPSEFTVPLGVAYNRQPLMAIRTINLIGVLSRIWVIDKVKLSCAQGVAVISAYSPIEVIDSTPPSTSTADAVATPAAPIPPGQGYIWPCAGTISSYANEIRNVGTSPHIGTDIVNAVGTPIKASNDGVVCGFAGAGICVNIKHSDGVVTRYMHMTGRAPGISIGTPVKRGQVIGYLGATGKVTGAHCHFDIKGAPNPKGTGYNTPDAIGLPYVKKGAHVS